MHDNISFFTNLLLLFSRWAGPFPHDELGLFQTCRGKSQPRILIVNFFLIFFPDELVPLQMSRLLPTSWLRGWHTILFSRWAAGAFPHVDELGLFQTSWEKCQHTILIVNLSFCIFQMTWPLSRWAGFANELVEAAGQLYFPSSCLLV